MSTELAFAHALLRPDAPCPAGLRAWNGSDPVKRYAVYRNNVVVSLVDALADSHPVTQALVGEAFFRAMAGEFARRSPPRSPVLAWYGEGFADFVADFPPAAGLPYLADLARLEWLRVEAWHAADADPLPLAEVAALLADEAALPNLRVTLHPALRVLRSAHPVVSLGSTLATIVLNPDITLVRGALALALLILLQFVISWTSARLPWVRRLVTGEPTLLLHRGEPLRDALRGARQTMDDVRAAVRAAGIARLEDVEAVVLETDGSISVVKRDLGARECSSLEGIALPRVERRD